MCFFDEPKCRHEISPNYVLFKVVPGKYFPQNFFHFSPKERKKIRSQSPCDSIHVLLKISCQASPSNSSIMKNCIFEPISGHEVT